MRVRFWGTRGSIPKPGASTLRYGGNTSCVEVRTADGTLLVLDCGSGFHELGLELMRSGEGGRGGSLLIGHTHWDHIQGFPFFPPFFEPEARWEIYAPGGRAQQIESSLGALMSYDHHPITLESLEARVHFQDLIEGELTIGGMRITTQYLHHPTLTLGYRIEADGAVLVYASDHEPHSLYPLHGDPGEPPIHHEDQRHVRFLEDADLVIHDAQFTLDQFPDRSGWGHTPVERAVDYTIAAHARRLALFHHDPERDDDQVDALVAMALERAAKGRHVPDVFGAAEGQWVEFPNRGATGHRGEGGPSALLAGQPARHPIVLVVDDDPDMLELLITTLDEEHVRLISATDGDSALHLTRTERPDLMLLDLDLPGLNGLEVCRAIRADDDDQLRDLPVLILTGTRLDEERLLEAFVAGATDFLSKPIKPTLVRSCVRGWLMRHGLAP